MYSVSRLYRKTERIVKIQQIEFVCKQPTTEVGVPRALYVGAIWSGTVYVCARTIRHVGFR